MKKRLLLIVALLLSAISYSQQIVEDFDFKYYHSFKEGGDKEGNIVEVDGRFTVIENKGLYILYINEDGVIYKFEIKEKIDEMESENHVSDIYKCIEIGSGAELLFVSSFVLESQTSIYCIDFGKERFFFTKE